jgi:hypothetical protein
VLAERPTERFSIQQMLEHPWFTSDTTLMATYGSSRAPVSHHQSSLHPHHKHLQHQQTAPAHSQTSDDQASMSALSGDENTSSSPLLGRRPSPSKIKSFSTSSAPSMNPIRLASDSPSCMSTSSLDQGSPSPPPSSHLSSIRPLSPSISSNSSLALALAMAEEGEAFPHPMPATQSSSPGKVSLPSLSPEKPSGQRSPEKTFAKRPTHPPSSPERPTSPKF